MLAMLSAFRAKDRLLKPWPELHIGYLATRTRRVSDARLAPTSGEVVTEFQSYSSRTDSPVRVLNAQPRSLVSVARFIPFKSSRRTAWRSGYSQPQEDSP
jgi:hypothetical protein